MTPEQGLAFGLMAVTIAAFIWGKLRYDLIALTALGAGAVLGIIPVEEMFSGFSNELIWIIASALMLSAAIARSGVIERGLSPVLARLKSPRLQMPLFTGLVMVLSMFTKNVGALAIMMPVALQHAQKANASPSRVLMPMAFASLLGGLVTLVGTSPNIIVSGVRKSIVGEPFQMFDFAPVGLGLCAIGFVFLAIAPRFIKIERQSQGSLDAALADAQYVTEVVVSEDSACLGKTPADLEAASDGDVNVVGRMTDSGRIQVSHDRVLELGDRLLVEGEQAALERAMSSAKLKLVGERHRDETEPSDKVTLIEGVVRQYSSLVGQSAAGARLYERFGVSLLAVSREGRQVREELRSLRFRPGDLLLLKTEEAKAGEALSELQILPLSERGVALGQKRVGYLPIAALGLAVLAVALGWAPIHLAFFAAAIMVLLLRTMSMTEAYRAIEGPMLVLVACLIPISETIQQTGGDKLIAGFLSQALGPMPPYIAIGALILTGMAVTPFLNNAATVLVVAPIGAAIAQALGKNPDPYLMAVAIGAACDFLTPIGHQCNTLVMGPGGYKFSDYWKLGLPLSVLVVVAATPLILWTWPAS